MFTWAAILTLLLNLLKKTWPYLLCITLGLYIYYKVDKWWDGDNSPDLVTRTVYKVVNGNTLMVNAGVFGFRKQVISLYGLDIPDEVSQQSLDNLIKYVIAGDIVKLEKIYTECSENSCELLTNGSWAIIYTSSGLNLNLEQIRQGLAITNSSRKDFITAQKEAQRAKRGIWAMRKIEEIIDERN